MRRAHVSSLKPGEIIGKTLYGENGQVLLAAGVKLTDGLIATLQRKKFYSVYLLDGQSDDIVPDDIVSERVRLVTMNHIRDLFSFTETSVVQTGREGQASSVQTKMGKIVDTLTASVETIMREVLDRPTLTGITALKSHDDYTFSHSVDVAVVSILLGHRLLLPRDEVAQLALGALMHDIGKIFVPDHILNKPGPLTTEEFQVMQSHTTEGYKFLIDSGPHDFRACTVCLQHHERQDGRGYPRALKGANRLRRQEHERYDRDRIHPFAEIASVADVYSAIASDRPYRMAMPPEQVAAVIRGMSGVHLNAEVVECFFATIPVFAIGVQVLLEGGRYDGYHGVVVENRQGQLDRPIVRLTADNRGNLIDGDDYDTNTDFDCRIVSPMTPEAVTEPAVVEIDR